MDANTLYLYESHCRCLIGNRNFLILREPGFLGFTGLIGGIRIAHIFTFLWCGLWFVVCICTVSCAQFCLVSCAPNVASFSGLFILYCPCSYHLTFICMSWIVHYWLSLRYSSPLTSIIVWISSYCIAIGQYIYPTTMWPDILFWKAIQHTEDNILKYIYFKIVYTSWKILLMFYNFHPISPRNIRFDLWC